ncbi:D-amino acid dehydrogenase [Paraburkholderia domus]|uniref:D-amino acid dehydrogenase n=1 Tax=Paraburkholderia domus TaxID=2793075 RepID=UPI0019135801|nr:D-amino acid dehydrogenase [Paraburkholderia domus]MBK5091266.1 D-amino acid dehydrogenase [Burkholderia sp. R-69927]CAE6931584.1 D-amino acid dehydrogenase [Paraburkholderia domus]
MNICILGAGIIGTTSAWHLLQAGHHVTLLDAMPQPAACASRGNGAQLSYSYVAPLADPSVLKKWPSYLFGRDSPLTLKPRPDTAQWRWLIQFLGACNAAQVQKTTIQLLHLAFYSRGELDTLRQHPALNFHHRKAGKLVMLSDHNTMQSARRQVEFQAAHGCHQQVLDVEHCVEIEPALAQAASQWVGGVYTASEEVGDCALFCRQLLQAMQKDDRFRFARSTRVTGVTVKDGVLEHVSVGSEKLQADAYVLAMGVESAAFARNAGFRLPVYPLKGYSITVPLHGAKADAAPQVSITDLRRKIVFARVGEHLRVAGRVELVGMDPAISRRATTELTSAVRTLFPGVPNLADEATLSPWAGFRPATPTGLPIIGPSPVKKLFLNVGHGSLGWTLSCGSAALLADLIAGNTTIIDAGPFRL